jgi:DNA-binding NarL/FixJ family response regulator
MKRLFVVGNDASIQHATRFARRSSSVLNLFAMVADSPANLRQVVRDAKPDIAVFYWPDCREVMDVQVRAVREESPSAVILVLTEKTQDSVLDTVCDAAAMACVSAASPPEGREARAADVAGARVNGSGVAGVIAPDANVATAARFARYEQEQDDSCRLTPRELEVLRAVSEGHPNARIARQLWVTEQTVKFHISNVYRKLGVSNRTEAGREAMARGLVSGPMYRERGAA